MSHPSQAAFRHTGGAFRWQWPDPPSLPDDLVAGSFDVSTPAGRWAAHSVAAAVVARGVEPRELASFVSPPSLSAQVARLRQHLPSDVALAARWLAVVAASGARCAIVPDYDTDGACAAACVRRALVACGADPSAVSVFVPEHLTEGYGPSDRVLAEAIAWGADAVAVLDSGTADLARLAGLRSPDGAAVRALVIDHHSLGSTFRPEPGVALCNPHHMVGGESLARMSAAGLAWLVGLEAMRLTDQVSDRSVAAGDMVVWAGLSTVADMMDIREPLNRAIVRDSLRFLGRGYGGPGLRALAEAAGLDPSRVTASDYGWRLGPRLNSGHRMGESSLASSLLTAGPGDAASLAQRLHTLNARRQASAPRSVAVDNGDSVVLVGPPENPQEVRLALPPVGSAPVVFAPAVGFTPGTVGLAASRYQDLYGRPAVAFALGFDGASVLHGSARSGLEGFDWGEVVRAAGEDGLLLSGGGHPGAAGLTLEVGRLAAFEAFVAAYGTRAAADRPDSPWADVLRHGPRLRVDVELTPSAMLLGDPLRALASALARCEPWGAHCPAPVIGGRSVRLSAFGKPSPRAPVRFDVGFPGTSMPGLWWSPPAPALAAVADARVASGGQLAPVGSPGFRSPPVDLAVTLDGFRRYGADSVEYSLQVDRIALASGVQQGFGPPRPGRR